MFRRACNEKKERKFEKSRKFRRAIISSAFKYYANYSNMCKCHQHRVLSTLRTSYGFVDCSSINCDHICRKVVSCYHIIDFTTPSNRIELYWSIEVLNVVWWWLIIISKQHHQIECIVRISRWTPVKFQFSNKCT